MLLLWCQQDLTAVFWNHGWLSPPVPPAQSPHSDFRPVPSGLPSYMGFLLALLNVTLEGATAPQASFSPPPFAVVGSKALAWRQLFGSQQGPCAQLIQTDKPAQRECGHAGQPLSPQPLPPPLHSESSLCISPNVHFTKCTFHQAGVVSSAQAVRAPRAPFQNCCTPSRIHARSPAVRW